MNIHHLSKGGEFFLPGAETHYAPSLSVEPFHMDLRLHVDIENKKLVATLTYRVHVHRPQSTLKLNAVDLDIISVDGDFSTWDYDGEIIDLHWNNKPNSEYSEVTISYEVHNPICGAHFGPNYMGTDHETSRARYWLPCVDHSAVRTSIDVRIEHNSEHTCLSTGKHISTNPTKSGWAETHWKFEGRCPVYLFSIMIGDLNAWYGDDWNGKGIAAFAPKPTPVEDIKRAFEPTAALLDFMTEKLGPLPWSKYYQFALPGIGGAMENISLVSWDDFWVFDEQMHSEWGELLDQINLHEMAHTWFGDLIVCRDYAHVWLKESWATYMEAVWFEGTSSVERFEYELLFKRERYFSEVKGRYSRPIMTRTFDTPWQMYDLHLYPGGAVRLHMLRKKMGDDCFWDAVRDYIQTYTYETVETDDFRKIMEKHAHQSLAHFFDQWFCRAGYPFLTIKKSFSENILTLSVAQSVKGAAKGEEEKFFDFPLEICVQNAQGEWSYHTLEITGAQQNLTLRFEEAPAQIIIDPHASSVMDYSFNPGIPMLEKTLQDCKHVNSRIHAYRTLIKEGKRIAFQKVQKAIQTEPFHCVRMEVAKSLGASSHPLARTILLERLQAETDPQAQTDVATACGSHWDADIAQGLKELLTSENIPYRTHAAALLSYAKQRDFCDENIIHEASKREGWWGFVRRGAATALGHLQNQRAAQRLIEMIHDTNEKAQVRIVAASSLGRCAKYFKDKERADVLALLHSLLTHDIYKMRVQAVSGLKILGEAVSVRKIHAATPMFASQDAPILERAIRGIHKQQKDDPSIRLQSKIDKLEKKIATLEDNIEKIQSRGTHD